MYFVHLLIQSNVLTFEQNKIHQINFMENICSAKITNSNVELIFETIFIRTELSNIQNRFICY